MVATDCCRIVKLLVSFWATSLIVSQKTNAQGTGASSKASITDTPYFFYQQSAYPRDCNEVFDRCSFNKSSGVHYIKPDGYSGPFEAYCDLVDGSVGWTVIHRREIGGMIDVTRDWSSYKNGSGFLSHEFWIGNERLSYLTNQGNYQLLIEFTLSSGSNVRVYYNSFRVGDEFSGYNLLSVTQYHGSTDTLSWCPSNMVYGNCTCGRKPCGGPSTCLNTCTDGRSEGCICPEGFFTRAGACVPQQECGCYIDEEQTDVSEGDTYVNNDCTRIATCSNGRLTWNERYECSSDAVCEERTGERRCYCKDGFAGDGVICESSEPTDCMDVYNDVSESSGVYIIKPIGWPGSPFNVYCNMTDGGGWTVFQRRIDGNVDFYLGWDSYKHGFGDVDDEHWLGNEQLYYLTNQRSYQLRVDLVNYHGAPYYAKFSSFGINNETDNYRLADVSGYSGTADSRSSPDGYALTYHRGYQFSTKDRDNDVYSSYHCAQYYHGAWWYKSCYYSNLNGDYHASRYSYSSIYWYYLPRTYYNIKFTEMKIRPM